jgi:hypothetical protein
LEGKFRVVSKPSVGPFDVTRSVEWFKFVRGAAVPAEEEAAKPPQDVKS